LRAFESQLDFRAVKEKGPIQRLTLGMLSQKIEDDGGQECFGLHCNGYFCMTVLRINAFGTVMRLDKAAIRRQIKRKAASR
jgi:hypothetical protein